MKLSSSPDSDSSLDAHFGPKNLALAVTMLVSLALAGCAKDATPEKAELILQGVIGAVQEGVKSGAIKCTGDVEGNSFTCVATGKGDTVVEEIEGEIDSGNRYLVSELDVKIDDPDGSLPSDVWVYSGHKRGGGLGCRDVHVQWRSSEGVYRAGLNGDYERAKSAIKDVCRASGCCGDNGRVSARKI